MALRTPPGIDVLELDVAKASIVSEAVLAAMVVRLAPAPWVLDAGLEQVADLVTRALLPARSPELP